MPAGHSVTVVILYRHPLFGEGIEHLLAHEPEMAVHSVPSADARAVADRLAEQPDVVIVERGASDTAVDVLRSAPDALVIDVALEPGPTFAYHREVIRSQPEGIIAAIRQAVLPGHRGVTSAPAVAFPVGIRGTGGI